MADDIHSSGNDLEGFEDYLSEFDSLISFDKEVCPVCGINISDSLKPQNSPYIVYKSFNSESDVVQSSQSLEQKGIPYKIEKQLDSNSTSEISYIFNLLIPFNCLDIIKKEKV